MEQDAQKWNRIFSSRTKAAPGPPEFLTRQHQALRPGTVLDVASGDGANALFLAENGFDVTAIDIASAGLARLAEFAASRNREVQTLVIDLDVPDALADLKIFDNIVISRFKPPLSAWPCLVERLLPGGFLALSTFNINHHLQTGFKRHFCLAPGELESIHPGLELLGYEGADLGDASMDSYLFQRLQPGTTMDPDQRKNRDIP